MTHRVRFVLVAALALGLGLPAAADDSKKVSSTMPGAAQQGGIAIKTPFNVWPDGQYIFVVNYGNADWTGPLDVSAVCKSTTANAPANACGTNFPGGKFKQHFATFPKGYGNLPLKGSGNSQVTSGAGWIAVFMGLPAGTYKITAAAANNVSPETTITIAPPPGPTFVVGPATISVKPK
jgi:hypothetical protein